MNFIHCVSSRPGGRATAIIEFFSVTHTLKNFEGARGRLCSSKGCACAIWHKWPVQAWHNPTVIVLRRANVDGTVGPYPRDICWNYVGVALTNGRLLIGPTDGVVLARRSLAGIRGVHGLETWPPCVTVTNLVTVSMSNRMCARIGSKFFLGDAVPRPWQERRTWLTPRKRCPSHVAMPNLVILGQTARTYVQRSTPRFSRSLEVEQNRHQSTSYIVPMTSY